MIKINTFKKSKYKDLKPDTKKPILPGLVLLFVILVGTIGYYYLWKDSGATITDALYMTIITISTIGFAETHPLNEFGRAFTMFIAIFGVGSLFYVLSVIMENLFIMQLNNYRGKKKKMKNIEKLSNHIIIIGYGRVGQLAADLLAQQDKKFVVIDDDFIEEDTVNLKDNLLKVVGDATEDSTLIKAGIQRAKGLIVSTGNAATTVFVVLSAKVLNPNIFIVARADEDSSIQKLMRAGADKVVNPYSTGGQRMANLILNPNLVDFFEASFDIEGLKIEHFKLPENSSWIGKTFQELDFRKKYGISILSVIRNSKPILNPGGDFKILDNDRFILMGMREDLNQIKSSILN